MIDGFLSDLVGTFPAVLVNGPRAAGKTASARRVAASMARLDRPAKAAGFGKSDMYKYASSTTTQQYYGSWTTNKMRGVGMDPDRDGNCSTIAW